MPAIVKRISVEDVLSWGSCDGYNTREDLLAVTPGKEFYTPFEVAALGIPIRDRQWALCRPEVMHKRDLRNYAIDCLEHVVHHWRPNRSSLFHPIGAILEARRFARGEITYTTLARVGSAAWIAARNEGTFQRFDALAHENPRLAVKDAARDALITVGVVAAQVSNQERLEALRSPDKATRTAASTAARQAEADWQMAQLIRYLAP